MEVLKQIELLESLLEEIKKVNYYSKDNFDILEGKAKMYVRKFFGDNSHYLDEINNISYSPIIFSMDSGDELFASAFNSGVKSLTNLIIVIIDDLKLSTNYQPTSTSQSTPTVKPPPQSQLKRKLLNQKEIHILIATPGDVAEERELLLNSLESKFRRAGYEKRCGFRIIVRGWEELATQTGYGQDIINTQILKEVDIVLAAFKHKLGTPTIDSKSGTERSKSGTAEELLYAIRNNDIDNPPLGMAYFYLEAPKISFDSPNFQMALSNWEELKEFKESIKNHILYKSYKSGEELLNTSCEDLVKNIETYFA